MLTKSLRLVWICFLFVLSTSALSQPEKYNAGTHYTVLDKPVPTSDSKKIEVIEAFWYGCPHCFSFEPRIIAWESNIPDDINFVRFPVIFNNQMKLHAQVYFTAVDLDVLEVVHNTIFETLLIEKKELLTENQIGNLFSEFGITQEDFLKSFNSFSVRTKLQQAEIRMRDYDLRGTPSIIVNGKYRVMANDTVRTQQEMLDIVDFLINKERTLK